MFILGGRRRLGGCRVLDTFNWRCTGGEPPGGLLYIYSEHHQSGHVVHLCWNYNDPTGILGLLWGKEREQMSPDNGKKKR